MIYSTSKTYWQNFAKNLKEKGISIDKISNKLKTRIDENSVNRIISKIQGGENEQ